MTLGHNGGTIDPTYEALMAEHEATVKAAREARATNEMLERYERLKRCVIGLYHGVPYVEEITEEGQKIIPGAPVLKELVDEVKKSNSSTLNPSSKEAKE
jgi:hypothetical protein